VNSFTNFNTDFFNITENEREVAVMLDNLADELMLENIKEQITDRIQSENLINYINIFEERYNFLIEKFMECPEILNQLRDFKNAYFIEINNLLYDKVGVKANEEDSNYILITKAIYEFFVLSYKENLINYFFNFIFKNKQSIVAKYEEEDKKTVDAISLKKTLKSKNDITILTNIFAIVNDILNTESDYHNLIDLIIEDDPNEKTNFIIKNLINESEFTNKIFVSDDLVQKFFKPLLDGEQNSTSIYFNLQTLIYDYSINKQEE
jgi:hypothetical protein